MSTATQYLQNRLDQATKAGDNVERALLIEMMTAWDSKEEEADRLSKATGVGRFLTK